jgi:hypothetical protein
MTGGVNTARQEPLRRWGLRSALTALLLVVLCESPFLALGLAAAGLGGSTGMLSGWLDVLAVVLLVGGVSAFGFAVWRRRTA